MALVSGTQHHAFPQPGLNFFPWYRFRYWARADLRFSPVPFPVPGARGVFGTRDLCFPRLSLVPLPVLLSIFPWYRANGP
jgi:hypothetical protein